MKKIMLLSAMLFIAFTTFAQDAFCATAIHVADVTQSGGQKVWWKHILGGRATYNKVTSTVAKFKDDNGNVIATHKIVCSGGGDTDCPIGVNDGGTLIYNKTFSPNMSFDEGATALAYTRMEEILTAELAQSEILENTGSANLILKNQEDNDKDYVVTIVWEGKDNHVNYKITILPYEILLP